MLLAGFTVSSFWAALVVALVMGIINVTIRPVLMLLSLPLNLLTLGLFSFVVNALLLLLAAAILDGFAISGFGAAFIAAILLAFGNSLINLLVKK